MGLRLVRTGGKDALAARESQFAGPARLCVCEGGRRRASRSDRRSAASERVVCRRSWIGDDGRRNHGAATAWPYAPEACAVLRCYRRSCDITLEELLLETDKMPASIGLIPQPYATGVRQTQDDAACQGTANPRRALKHAEQRGRLLHTRRVRRLPAACRLFSVNLKML